MAIFVTLSPGEATAVNDNGETVGNFSDARGQHAFIYIDGTYSVFDAPGASVTTATAVDAAGDVAGYYRDLSGGTHGFVYSNGTYTTVNAQGLFPATFITSINFDGGIAGYFHNNTGTHGFVLSDGVFSVLTGSLAVTTKSEAINASGVVVGTYNDGIDTHGFMYSGGVYTTLDAPGAPSATDTFAKAVNSSGEVVGYYSDDIDPYTHGFVYANNTFTVISVPGADDTFARAINSAGDIAGTYDDATGQHIFVDRNGHFSTFDVPENKSTTVTGINSRDEISGYYTDATGEHAFLIASPKIGSSAAVSDTGATLLGVGRAITITLHVNEAVDVVGAPQLHLNVGQHATYVAGSGTDTLTFTYTVQLGDNAAHLQVTGLDLNGGSIKDDLGVALLPTVTGDFGLTIDTIGPTITIGQQLAHDTGASASDRVTNDGSVTLSGSVADANGVASVEVFDGKTDLGAAGVVGGAWSFSGLLSEGSHTLSAIATDLAGNPTATAAQSTILVDTIDPTITIGQQLVHDTGASASDRVTNDGNVTLSGSVADANGVASVEVFDGKTDLGAANVVGGAWSFSGLLSEGSHTLSAIATDLAGNPTATAAQPTIVVDITPPTPVLLNADYTNSSGLTTLIGLSEAGSSVSVFNAGELVGTTKAAADGTWSMTTNIGGKAVQSYAESATDLAGNVGWSPGVALLYQQSSNQTLVGGSGNDVLIANHLDTLTGGAGSDTFVFNPGFGKSNITDFDVGQDILRIDHNLFTSVSGVFSHSKDSGAGMVISFNAANTITLVGVHAADLQAHQDHVQLF